MKTFKKSLGKAVLIFLAVLFLLPFVSAQTYDPTYPNPYDKIFEERHGQINCRNTGAWSAVGAVYWQDIDGDYARAVITCPTNVGTVGCQYSINEPICGTKPWCCINHVIQLRQDYGSWESWDSSKWEGKWFALSEGESTTIEARCGCPLDRVTPAFFPINLREAQKKLYVETHGYTEAGWLDGSEDCKLVSTDARTLKNMQKTDSPLEGVSQLNFGETKNIVVAWEEQPAFGNVNPLGRYENQDIICKPYDGIYAIEKVATVGGYTYYKRASQLASYVSDNTLCCSQDECGGNYKCEDYHCQATTVCEYGQCNYWQIGDVLKEECREEGGRFYIVKQTCGQDQCIQEQKTEVQCCRAYCDRMSTPTDKYYCNYDQGCVKINYLKECGSGYCCLKDGQWKEQSCLEGKECCWGALFEDPFKGICKDSCEGGEEGGEENCIARGGIWVTKELGCKLGDIPCYVGLKGKETIGYCRIPHVSIMAIIFIVLGIIGAIASVPTGLAPLLPIGIIIMIAGIIMQILASAGLV